MTTQRYIVGRPFKSHEGQHLLGELAPLSAASWYNVESLVGFGLLYAVAPSEGYDRLPPHVFSAVRTRQEIAGIIQVGESPVTFNEWVEAEQLQVLRDEIEAEEESKRRNAEHQQARAVKLQQVVSQVEVNPVVVVHPVAGVDAMKAPAEAAAQAREDNEKAEPADTEPLDDSTADAQPEVTGHGPRSQGQPIVPDTEDGTADARADSKYVGLTKGQLLEEIEKRNADREQKLTTSGNKADLVAVLDEDDRA